ncbi:NAD(P)H-quinone oxidoreductase [Rhodoplanes sp. TEM]|uniref:NAD(P)H-quinone oxidoreductase n=1 Tax=Rhodoplanes tepidamans TaxID=200616 RepID=A0ABT5JEX3_RHOTP|nr:MULTISPECIES: NAD(P)H-quinone oxidoreductase [Rhodoplanes]MDC7788048.1 NAD(P)H-quinone oxidoreductase [Rhodoplanes tepidamans]MDC7987541.1 NAD(P)H-quinone oxidoreductase [Rhodoplanes sp. TEM]MDQ0353963.1 NADPH2:quinone reductase [Rhodoplanes tepidamans]
MTDSPARMTAIGIPTPGGPEVLRPEERPVPTPGPGEILVKVAAAGVNRPDVVQRKGHYPPPPGASDIPGLEICGTVVARGPEATRFAVGDRVMALVSGGGYAQFCVAHESHALPAPAALSDAEAAAVPETLFTVWHNVFERGGLKAGETLLVHGGSSGIGTMAIQLAKAFGATVIVTAGSAEKCAACVTLGADTAIDYKTQDFVAETKAATGGAGANVILDMVGGDYIDRNYEAAAVDGRIVQIAFQGPSKATVDFRRIMLKRLHHTGSTLRSRSVADKAAIVAAAGAAVGPLLAAGRVKPVMDTTFPLADAAKAHARMESSAHIGKIVLLV